ncbi:MAG: RHS repeat-associated core domain-containing protein [Planctomycetes bacterium]|nr:RHS repeat-associated core domain-containing protein [Planctomycetota bacterium]
MIFNHASNHITPVKRKIHRLSGRSLLESAGGIGGLLSVYDYNGTSTDLKYIYCYDANGNVTQLLDPAATGGPGVPPGAIVAHYEYDPYGNAVVANGTYATSNRWRFSTKTFDAETGVGYCGYRYYAAIAGRWLGRDPLEEADGPALLAFVQNFPTNGIDGVGLRQCAPKLKSPLPPAYNEQRKVWNFWNCDFVVDVFVDKPTDSSLYISSTASMTARTIAGYLFWVGGSTSGAGAYLSFQITCDDCCTAFQTNKGQKLDQNGVLSAYVDYTESRPSSNTLQICLSGGGGYKVQVNGGVSNGGISVGISKPDDAGRNYSMGCYVWKCECSNTELLPSEPEHE